MARANVWLRPMGLDGTFVHDIRDSAGNVIGATAYNGTETLTARLWQGGQLAVIGGVVTSAWHQPFDGTVDTTVIGTGTSTMTPGFYRVEVTLTKSGSTVPIYRGWLGLEASPGSETLGPIYADFGDLVQYGGDWVIGLISDYGESNFQRELERARTWLDEAILAQYRPGAYQPNYLITPIYNISWWGPLESYNVSLQECLAANALNVTDHTREICSHKALGIVCGKKIDFDEQGQKFQQRASYHNRMAHKLLMTYVAELDTDADGFIDIAFNMGAVSLR